jgi:sugar (pentulose or hexulose) kinase
VGLSLSHTRAHIWRGVLEGVCYGTRACLEALVGKDLSGSASESARDCSGESGEGHASIYITGGVLMSPMWLQMHADVTGLPVRTSAATAVNGEECRNISSALIGCAVLAKVGYDACNGTSGEATPIIPSKDALERAVASLVKTGAVITPDAEMHQRYNEVYKKYTLLVPALKQIFHS